MSASQSSQGESQVPTEIPLPKKESTKNVSFKNHTDTSPSNTYRQDQLATTRENTATNREQSTNREPTNKEQLANNREQPATRELTNREQLAANREMQAKREQYSSNREHSVNTFRGHAEVLSSNGGRPVMEKDQLAKSPYGWRQEVSTIINILYLHK